jgi:hypothetical protein
MKFRLYGGVAYPVGAQGAAPPAEGGDMSVRLYGATELHNTPRTADGVLEERDRPDRGEAVIETEAEVFELARSYFDLLAREGGAA